MYQLLCNGYFIDEFETEAEAERARDREVLDACREDVLYGGYSKGSEESYYNSFTIEEA